MKNQCLQLISDYQRPIRTVIWVILIVAAFIYIIFTGGKEDMSKLGELLVIGMFADMGIYAGLKTYEKVQQAKINGNQSVVESVVNAETPIENMNVGNTNVNIDKKNPPPRGE